MGGQTTADKPSQTRGGSADAAGGGPIDDERDIALEGRSFIEAEHGELRRLIDRIEETSGLVVEIEAVDAAHELRALLDALAGSLVPHMEWEEAFCYPQLDGRAGTPWATRLLREQHRQIRSRLDRLESDVSARLGRRESAEAAAVRTRLLGLAELIASHIEEESLVLPLLDDDLDDAGRRERSAGDVPAATSEQRATPATASRGSRGIGA